MNPTSLTKITLEGYKSFRKLELELRPLNVLVGANGVGKSNLISSLRLPRALVSGKFQRMVSQAGGADAFLRYGKKETKYIFVQLRFQEWSYEVEFRGDATDALYIYGETFNHKLIAGNSGLRFQGTNASSGGRESAFWFDARNPLLESNENDLIEKLLLLSDIRTYHFHDTTSTAAIKGLGGLNDNIELRSDGENLAAILFKIRTQNLKAYQTIRDVIRSVAPYFDDFILRPNPLNMDTIRLEWREHDSDYPFIARDLSDGTLRFMALTTLLLQPEPPAIIVIDEPELGLHPFAIEKLAGLLQTASSRAQLIVATQSPQLIAALEPEDIIVADRKDGETTMQRLDAENLKDWLEEYTLGELWQKNILGGVVNPNNVRSRGNS
jgi:predicted ATPase